MMTVPFDDPLPYEPLTFTLVSRFTAVVKYGTFTLLTPAGTVTVAGSFKPEPMQLRCTTAPPTGAGPTSNTLPEPCEPAFNGDGMMTARIPFGLTVRFDHAELAAFEAVMPVKTSLFVITAVLTVNCTLDFPAGTVTVCGIEISLVCGVSVMTAPPAGAAPDSVSVAWEGSPP